jgi:hypothetical protein
VPGRMLGVLNAASIHVIRAFKPNRLRCRTDITHRNSVLIADFVTKTPFLYRGMVRWDYW